MFDGLLHPSDLDRMHERRRRAQRVVLRLESGEVLAVGHAPLWAELDAPRAGLDTFTLLPWTTYTYSVESVVRLGLFTREEVESYLALREI